MIATFKVELRLFHSGSCGSGGHGLFLRTDILHLHIGRPKFMEYGFDDLAVGSRQDLPKDRAGDLYKQVFTLGAIQPGGLKPGGVCVDADPGLHALKKPIPGIRRSSHRKRKSIPAISTDVNKLWKAGPFLFFIVFRLRESCPYRSVLLSPGARCAALMELPAPRTYFHQTARDCRRLGRLGQAKSVRRDSPGCTSHSQLFHKHYSCATPLARAHLRGNSRKIFTCARNFAQVPSKSP